MMKRLLYVLPVIFMLISACDKKETESLKVTCPAPSQLEGKWELLATWNSPGAGDIVWMPAQGKDSITFSNDLHFSSSKNDLDRYYITLLNDADTSYPVLKLYKNGNKDTSSYVVAFKADTLDLHFIGCYEGCAERYVRHSSAGVQQ
jgi:hypothetical protein